MQQSQPQFTREREDFKRYPSRLSAGRKESSFRFDVQKSLCIVIFYALFKTK